MGLSTILDFLGDSVGKESTCNAGDLDLIPGLRRSSGEGNGNPLQYSCLENSMGRGVRWATVHGVTKESDTTDQLNNSNKTILTVGEPVELASSRQPRVCNIAL